jgi:FkbM family methyltransferase
LGPAVTIEHAAEPVNTGDLPRIAAPEALANLLSATLAMGTASDDAFYREVPKQLLLETMTRAVPASPDPLLCAYQRLLDKFRVPRTGVIHLGGHVGQELPMYAALGFKRVVMVEPQEREYEELRRRVESFNLVCGLVGSFVDESPPSRAHAVRCAVSDRSGTNTLYQTRVSSLSSLARPVSGNFADQWSQMRTLLPWYKRPLGWWMSRAAVRYREVSVLCKTLDELVGDLPGGWRARDFSYLRMNIQGSELRALQGGGETLRHVAVIDLETNIDERYEGAPGKREFDELLAGYGFRSVLGYRVGPMGNLVYARGAAAA